MFHITNHARSENWTDCDIMSVDLSTQTTEILLGDSTESIVDAGYWDKCHRSVVCPSVCLSVTLVHAATAVGRNVLLDTDSRVVSAETGPGSNVKRRFGVGTTIIICVVTCGFLFFTFLVPFKTFLVFF